MDPLDSEQSVEYFAAMSAEGKERDLFYSNWLEQQLEANDLITRVADHLHALSPHVRERKTACLLNEALLMLSRTLRKDGQL